MLELVARHPDVDAVIYLGIGIQSNQARLMRAGRFYPDHGLERIVAYHERQDARFAAAAAEVSESTGKPVLTATELAVADPQNPGPRAVRESGRLCYPSAYRAVTALEHLWRYARHRERRARAMRFGRLLAIVLVLAAAGCVFFAVQDDDAPAATGGPASAVVTPLWSPRRVPQPFVDLVGAQHLQARARRGGRGNRRVLRGTRRGGHRSPRTAPTPRSSPRRRRSC